MRTEYHTTREAHHPASPQKLGELFGTTTIRNLARIEGEEQARKRREGGRDFYKGNSETEDIEERQGSRDEARPKKRRGREKGREKGRDRQLNKKSEGMVLGTGNKLNTEHEVEIADPIVQVFYLLFQNEKFIIASTQDGR